MQTGIDSLFYQKFVCVPWNIVSYNVFSGSSKGPNIYGTEPWHFYIRNLVLNFGIWLPLALLTIPLIGVQHFLRKNPASRTSLIQTAAYASPFYLWLAIFTLQPHKEERFMYPAYPFLALNGALSLHALLGLLGRLPRPRLLSPRLVLALAGGAVAASTLFSVLRTAGLAAGLRPPRCACTRPPLALSLARQRATPCAWVRSGTASRTHSSSPTACARGSCAASSAACCPAPFASGRPAGPAAEASPAGGAGGGGRRARCPRA